MPYYFVLNYEVTDQTMFEQYVQLAAPMVMKHRGKYLILDHEPNDIEGNSARSLVVVEFESEEAAMQFYNAPEYQAIVNLRTNATDGWARGVAQFVMPES